VRLPILVAHLLLLAATPVLPQSPPTGTLAAGTWSFAFALPSAGATAVGAWRMMSPRTNLGVNLSFSATRSTATYGNDSTSTRTQRSGGGWSLRIEPTVKLYRHVHSSVAPFVLGQVGGSYEWNGEGTSSRSPRANVWSLTARVGAGADWFPVAAVSIGGWVAIGFRVSRSHSSSDAPYVSDLTSLNVGTLASALFLHIYF
jgi:hypothetical protein